MYERTTEESVERSPSSDSRMTFTEFLRRFPATTVPHYLKVRFYPDGTACPKCGKPSRFHRIKGRSAYSCQYCGHHVYPTAGTIFHKTDEPPALVLRDLPNGSSQCGITAKQLGARSASPTRRRTGCSSRSARCSARMRAAVRRGRIGRDLSAVSRARSAALAQDRLADRPLIGERARRPSCGRRARGRVRADRRPRRLATLAQDREYVLPDSMIFTDEWKGYERLAAVQGHKRIKHKERIYVDGDAGPRTWRGSSAS